jgi:hypothetical protein
MGRDYNYPMLSPLNGRRKGILKWIANLVIKERSFLPDFSKAALSELENMRQVDGGGGFTQERPAPAVRNCAQMKKDAHEFDGD